jgi:hypothetical protein
VSSRLGDLSGFDASAVNLEKYKNSSGHAAMRDLNIEGMYRIVKARK